MTGGPHKSDGDDKAKESFFDRVARGVHETSGDLTNKIVGFVAHEDLAEKFAQPINGELARQYMQGKAILESRQAEGKSAADMSGLSQSDRAAVRAYQKVHTDLPASIPLVDRDALIRQVERNIEAKARERTSISTPAAPASAVKIPEPHAVAPKVPTEPIRKVAASEIKQTQEVHTPAKISDAVQQTKPVARAIPKPNEPEARELRSPKPEEIRTESAPKFTPVLGGKQPAPEWMQERMQTFTGKPPAQGNSALAVQHKLAEAPLPFYQPVSTIVSHRPASAGNASATPEKTPTSSDKTSTSSDKSPPPDLKNRWIVLAKAVDAKTTQTAPRPQSHEKFAVTGVKIARPSVTVDLPHPRLLHIATINSGFPIGRIFGERLVMLPLATESVNRTVNRVVNGVVIRAASRSANIDAPKPNDVRANTQPRTDAKLASSPGTLFSPAAPVGTSVEAHSGSASESKSQLPLKENQEVKAVSHSVVHADGNAPIEATSITVQPPAPESASESTEEPEQDGDSESKPNTTQNLAPEAPRGTGGSRPIQTYIVRSFVPDKRYITGSELAFVAIMALASASRVRPEESATEHGLGLVRREYVLVEEEPWTEPDYVLPEDTKIGENPKKVPVEKVGPAEEDRAGDRTGGKRPEPARKVLTRPQILVQEGDDLCQMAGELFNDTRLGHLIADINLASLTETVQEGARVVKLITRQRLSLPVYQDILTYTRVKMAEAGDQKLITIVENTAIERELLDDQLSAILGFNSKNRDPLQ